MQYSKLAIRKGNHLSIEGTQKGYLFLSKIVHIKDFPGGRGGLGMLLHCRSFLRLPVAW